MNKPTCYPCLTNKEPYASLSRKLIEKYLKIVFYPGEADYLISFQNPEIISPDVLKMIKKMSINIHPSLPEYRGVCCVSRALYDDKKEYGVTAHIIEKEVDSGRILKVFKFPIHNDTCESLDLSAKNNSLLLLEEILQDIVNGKTDWECNEVWSDNLMTRKQFQEWITLPVNVEKAELDRMIKAVKRPGFPGPFIKLHGYKFSLYG